MHVRSAEVDGNFIKIYRDIAQRTFTRQGKGQVDIYLQTLYDGMELLTGNPEVSHWRNDS